jgi:hypothetical protein
MTQAQLDLAHKTIGDLGHCVRAMEQYGNAKIASCMRNAASLLQAMVDEAEQAELPLGDQPTTMGGIDRSPSAVYRHGLTGGDDDGR